MPDDQRAPVEYVPEGHQQDEPGEVAELAGRDQPSQLRSGQPEFTARGLQYRLDGVDRGHRHRAHRRQDEPLTARDCRRHPRHLPIGFNLQPFESRTSPREAQWFQSATHMGAR